MFDTFEGKQLKAFPFLLQTNHYLSFIGVAVARRICNEVIFFFKLCCLPSVFAFFYTQD